MQLYRCLVLNNCPHNCCYICIYVTSQDLFMWKKIFQEGFTASTLCVLIIKCLFRLLPKTTHVCNKKREICMLEKKMYLYNFEGKPFNKSVHGRLLSSLVLIPFNSRYLWGTLNMHACVQCVGYNIAYTWTHHPYHFPSLFCFSDGLCGISRTHSGNSVSQ